MGLFTSHYQPSQLPRLVQWQRICLPMQENAREAGSISGLVGRSPAVGSGIPLQYFLPGKFFGQRTLAGYCPRVGKMLDTTEHTHTQTHTYQPSRASVKLTEFCLVEMQIILYSKRDNPKYCDLWICWMLSSFVFYSPIYQFRIYLYFYFYIYAYILSSCS